MVLKNHQQLKESEQNDLVCQSQTKYLEEIYIFSDPAYWSGQIVIMWVLWLLSEWAAKLRAARAGLPRTHLILLRTKKGRAITMENLNPHMIKLEYAVRGPLVTRALAIEKELIGGAKKPYKRVIKANIGDAHAMGQRPLTFIRQVLAAVSYPKLIKAYKFPSDVKQRAKNILGACGGKSVGAYSISYGIEMIRRHAADYIQKRDNHPANWEDIVLSTGASTAIKNVLEMLCNNIDGKLSGVMIPIPQYPLYSATLAEYGLASVPYYLDEDNDWSLDLATLEDSLNKAQDCKVRALVVINPGNPTGQVLTQDNIKAILKFAHDHSLLLMADEVYQDNTYVAGRGFHSFKKVMMDMGDPIKSELELASFMSISKCYMGECGLRSGYMELVNFNKDVQAELYKTLSASLCPNILGQVVMDCVAKPPSENDQSYPLWKKERDGILESLRQRAIMLADSFNAMEGFKCNTVQGAMYAFPRFDLSPKALAAAKKAGKAPDVFYAFKLLEETGICVVAGSGFRQRPGTYHFRTTILPQPDLLQEMLTIFKNFHAKFNKEFK